MAREVCDKEDKYDHWAVESAWRAIKNAEKYKNDPKMLALVKEESKKQLKAAQEADATIALENKVDAKLSEIGQKMAEED